MVAGRVSVIIPCYNYARYLEEAVESVRAQTYSDWEIVSVDDGSSDDTPAVSEKLRLKDPTRIRTVRTPNQGVAAARNRGIAESTGEFILPLDADDCLKPEGLSLLVRALQSDSKAGIAYGCMEIFDTASGEPTQWIPGPNSLALLPMRNFIPISSMFRRTACESGVRYREGFFEDWDMWLQIIALGYTLSYVPEFVFRYRRHPHGRDTRNRFFYFQALAEQSRQNPTLYGEDLRRVLETLLANAPECYKKPTALFLPRPGSKEFIDFSGPMRRIADAFLATGHTVGALGNYMTNPANVPGLFQLEVAHGNYIDNVIFNIGRLGAEVILFHEADSVLSLRLKRLENVFAVVNVGTLADEHADISGHGMKAAALVSRAVQVASDNQKKITERFLALRQTLRNLESRKNGTQATAAPGISVLIPVRNVDTERLERCFQAIRETHAPAEIPIIISDFGSQPEHSAKYRELATRYGVELLTNPTRSPWSRSRALNIAIRACRTPWVLMTDADMIFHPDLIPMWRDYHSAIGDGVMYLAQCRKLPPILRLPSPWSSHEYARIADRGRLFDTHGQGGCQILETAWLHKVRGFNENYIVWGLEDNDLSFRADMDGLRTVWMEPGKLLHQWHIKAVPTKERDSNREQYNELLRHPRLVVNGETWGALAPAETAEYASLGPLVVTPSVEYTTAKQVEQAIFGATSVAEQVELLNRWGNHALHFKQDETALETFEDVLTLDRENVAGMLGLAQVLIIKFGYTLAGHYAAKILMKDPNNTAARQILEHVIKLSEQI